MKEQITVLILLFEGYNTLDVNGPLEVLCNAASREPKTFWCPFNIIIASKDGKPVKAFEFITMTANITFEDATKMINDKKIDVLITPGYGDSQVGVDLITEDEKNPKCLQNIFNPIRAFLNLDSTDKMRWMISICVGAIINAHSGCYDGRPATTHFLALGALSKYSNGKAQVVRKRWVDGGTTDNGVRIVSSGGISCGIDCMLWYVSNVLTTPSAAENVAYMMDYSWVGPMPPPTRN